MAKKAVALDDFLGDGHARWDLFMRLGGIMSRPFRRGSGSDFYAKWLVAMRMFAATLNLWVERGAGYGPDQKSHAA